MPKSLTAIESNVDSDIAINTSYVLMIKLDINNVAAEITVNAKTTACFPEYIR